MDKSLFGSAAAPPPDTKNAAGGDAYALPPQEALAQLACTGVFADTFYTKAEDQLSQVIAMAKQCDDEFVAKVAVYARQAGHMKDMPAVLLAYLFGKKAPILDRALFDAVIDNAKMLSNFVMAVRSNKFGRVSLGTKGKKLIGRWLNDRKLDYLWKQSIAKDPSIADCIRLGRPKVATEDVQRHALYRKLIGKDPVPEDLPELVRDTEAFRADPENAPLPDVPFNMIDSVPLTTEHWIQLFDRGGLQFIRMNLNTAARHGLFKDHSIVGRIAARLADKQQVLSSRQFPYQWLVAYLMAKQNPDLPPGIRNALHEAMEHATENVPSFEGEVYVAIDCSGSMGWPITGYQRSRNSSVVRCADVSSLFAACFVRKSPQTRLLTYSDDAVFVPVEPRDSVMTIGTQLASAGGGTDCSAPLRLLAAERRKVDLFIMVSDNESWLDGRYGHYGYSRGHVTGTVEAWAAIKRQNPSAKQVRINITPNATDQLPHRPDTLRVGGFNDSVFTAISRWYAGSNWIETIRSFSK